jgi:putative ABC transport system ATP-binding protein
VTNGDKTMIRLQEVEKVYRTDKIETVALTNINLAVREGEFISVMGPSGCGKSTLLNLMGLLDVPTGGKVALDGTPIESYEDRLLARLRNREIGFIFQTFHLIPDLTVLDNVQIPLLYRKLHHAERRKLALAALDRVGLSSRNHHIPSHHLADEPTGNLDSQMGEDIMSILEDLKARDKTTVVMVTHDPRLAAQTERTVRLFDGRQVN